MSYSKEKWDRALNAKGPSGSAVLDLIMPWENECMNLLGARCSQCEFCVASADEDHCSNPAHPLNKMKEEELTVFLVLEAL